MVESFLNVQTKTKVIYFMSKNYCSVFELYIYGKVCVAYVRIYFLFFIFGVLCVTFLYQRNLFTGIAPLINKFVF